MRLNWPPSQFEDIQLPDGPLFVTAKIHANDVASVGILEKAGFGVVDASLVFSADYLAPGEQTVEVGFAQPEDEQGVRSLASRAFRFSRFHLDPAIPNDQADRIKAEWAGNFFRGQRGDGMIVARANGMIIGFLQLLWEAGGTLVIDLIAVAPEAFRRGVAKSMVGLAAAAGTGDGRSPRGGFRVGTQAANMPSCAFYENLGFRLNDAAFVMHHHGRSSNYGAAKGKRA